MVNKRYAFSLKTLAKEAAIIAFLSLLAGSCSNNLQELGNYYQGQENTLNSTSGAYGTPIDIDGDFIADGIDVNNDGAMDMVFVNPIGPPVTGVDIDQDGQADFYLIEKSNGSSSLNISPNGSGLPVNLVYTNGVFQGYDLNNDSIVDTNSSGISTSTFKLSGTIAGLNASESVVLRMIKPTNEILTVSSNGYYQFTNQFATGTSYEIIIDSSPSGSVCTISSSASSVVQYTDITNIDVNCNPKYFLGGTVSNLVNNITLSLESNNYATEYLQVSGGATVFTFNTKLPAAENYFVSVVQQPTGQTCTLGSSTGIMPAFDLNTITLTCPPEHAIGGNTITGLNAKITLALNYSGGVEYLTVLSAATSYQFSNTLAEGESYLVTIATQPTGQVCTITAPSGFVGTGDVIDANIDCPTQYTLGGNGVTSLTAPITLALNYTGGVEYKTIPTSATDTYTFNTKLVDGNAYFVSISGQPAGQTCSLQNLAGTVLNATGNVTNINIACPTYYAVGGSVTGLTGTVTLQLSSAEVTETLALSANGVYAFTGKVADTGLYSVIVTQQPSILTCLLPKSSGNIAAGDVIDINVICQPWNAFASRGGSPIDSNADGLVEGIDMDGNGVLNTGDMSFVTPGQGMPEWAVDVDGVAGTDFYVYVDSSGNLLFNTGTGLSGAVVKLVKAADGTVLGYDTNGDGILDFSATGGAATYSVGGTVTGLSGSVVLSMAYSGGTEGKSIAADGAYSFNWRFADGGFYSVTVTQQPANMTCIAFNTAGTIAGISATNVDVVCQPWNAFAVLGSPIDANSDGIIEGIDLDGNGVLNTGDMNFVTPIAGTMPEWKIDITGDNVEDFFLYVGVTGNASLHTLTNRGGTAVSLVYDGTGNFAGYDTNADGAIEIDATGIATYPSGGTITGLTGTVTLSLDYNGGTELSTQSLDGAYTFNWNFPSGETYLAGVATQPAIVSCIVLNGSGAVPGNEANINVVCQPWAAFAALGSPIDANSDGIVEGIDMNGNGVLNTGDMNFVTPITGTMPEWKVDVTGDNVEDFFLYVGVNGNVSLHTATNKGGTVVSRIYNGVGSFAGYDTNADGVMEIDAAGNVTLPSGGTVSGLNVNDTVTLSLDYNGGTELLNVSANGAYNFNWNFPSGETYLTTIATQPATVTCLLFNGSGAVPGNEANINVVCQPWAAFAALGSPIDANADGIVEGIDMNGNGVLNTGDITFVTPGQGLPVWDVDVDGVAGTDFFLYVDATGNIYLNTANDLTGTVVSVVTNASGNFAGFDMTGDGLANVNAGGTTVTYHQLGGTVSGLTGNATLSLTASGATEYLYITADGAYTFNAWVAEGDPYAAQLVANSVHSTCTLYSFTGTVPAGGVNNIDMVCTTNIDAIIDITTSAGAFPGGFDKNITTYALTVGYMSTAVDITAFTSDPAQSSNVFIDGTMTQTGSSVNVPLTVGVNSFTVYDTVGALYQIEITRQSAAAFAQDAYMKQSNTDPNGADEFGTVMSVSGNTLVVGAPFEDNCETGIWTDTNLLAADVNGTQDCGAVYVFVRDPVAGTWSLEAYLKPAQVATPGDTIDVGDNFGASVDIEGDTIIVGAPFEDDVPTPTGDGTGNASADSGAVYVFERTGTTWAQTAYMKHDSGGNENLDRFGSAVAIYQDTIAIGCPFKGGSAQGRVYIWARVGGVWTQQIDILAANVDANDNFGTSLDLYGDTLAIGAPLEDSNVYGVVNGTGTSVDNTDTDSGAVYIYTGSLASWTQQAFIKASDGALGDEFGRSIKLYMDSLAVGAALSDTVGVDAGAAYVYTRTGVNWAEEVILHGTNTEAGDLFGTSVSINGDILIVGAPGEASNLTGVTAGAGTPAPGADNDANAASGAGYLYTRTAGPTWTLTYYLKASNSEAGDNFGAAVFTNGDFNVVGATLEDSIAQGFNGNEANNTAASTGALYIFR